MYKGVGGLTHLSIWTKKAPFCIYFVIFSYAMIIFLSLKCFTVFFSMELLLGCLNAFPLEMEGGQMGKSKCAMGGAHRKGTCVYDDGGEVKILAILEHAYQLNSPYGSPCISE